ncbi:hypothetical protein SAMN06265171_10510 [Chryseobacterium rhizoplanae]|uniref:Uncharacterized protein n=1 Tax=Chryseobacterium rhizoplanae TaxID=1609531 RepID=A0A521DDX0_9FLAO|nr:hypothetical protein [Chryseobacterium rhizoplanae]SMO69792.1 hypothetical protein SAMN06265171_10510 [Chryseobacterium rhizoplanae]
MIAPEYFNNHIAVEGEIIVKSVPNDAGSVMVWNSVTKKISTRTHAEIVADLDLMTLSTNQFVNGQKYFISSGISDEYSNRLWVRSEDGSEPGITFWKTGFISSTLTLRNDGFHFGVGANNHYDHVKAEGFRKNGSSDNFFLTGGGNDYDSRKKEDSWVHSGRNFPQGTFIETDIDYSATYGDQFLLEMKGNMYSNGQYLPLDSKIQGYIYNDTIISEGGYSTLNYFNYVICLNFNGKLAIWFPGMGYWQGFDAKITVGYGGLDQGRNRVTSITDSGDPGGTKRVQINLKHLLTKEELISENTFWEKKDIGSYWALDSDKPIAGLNGSGAQVILSGGLLASPSYTDSQFIPANGIHSRGFVQSDEGFQNRFYKVNERNRIWSFANADSFGISYFQGSGHVLGEGINFHFGDAGATEHQFFIQNNGRVFSEADGNSGDWKHKEYNINNYLGADYISGGQEKPNSAYFGAGKLKLQMLEAAQMGFSNMGWSDVLWMSSYNGSDVKKSTAIVSSKYNNRIGFVKQDYDSDKWGEAHDFWTTFNLPNPAAKSDLDNYVTLNTQQTVEAKKTFNGATGNSYSESAIMVNGNGSTIYPSIGFHQPGNYAGIISLRNSNQFYFRNADDSDFNYLLAKGYVKSGSDDSYVLLGGGGHLPVSSFNSSNYIDYVDDREMSPGEIGPTKFRYGFTSWDQNNSAPWADFLHFGGYSDASGGDQNLIVFKKNGFGIRQYLGAWQDTNKYNAYVEYWNSDHFSNNDINNWNNLVAASSNYVTLNTEQLVNARKAIQGATGNRYDQSAIETRGNGSTIYPSIGFHQPGSHAGTISLRDPNQFYFRNTDDSDFNYLLAKGFAKYGSDDDHFLTGSGGHYPKSGKDDAFIHSGRDFSQGTRILTNIDYSQSTGAAFLLEIKGNMYGGGMVMDCKVQGYIYNDTIINVNGYSTHPLLTEIIALNLNGELCFWFPRLSYWQGFSVKVTDVTSAGGTTTTNKAYQIADTTDPGGTKRVSIPIVTVATQNWVNNQSFVTTNTIQAITALKEFYDNLAIANGQSILLKGSADAAHYIKHFSDDTDGFGVSTGFAVKNYSTLENLFNVTSVGFGKFTQNVQAGGFLKTGSSNDFVLLGYGDHKPLSDFWTANNFNPDTKVGAWENATALGFSNGVPNNDNNPPYIYSNSNDSYTFLATQSWVNNNFTTAPFIAQNYALRSGSNATGSWINAAYALTNNPNIPGRIRNSAGDVYLNEATYGDVMGMINNFGTASGNPTDQWYHRIKMLHSNGAGYYTEIGVQMTGGNSMQYRRLENGKFGSDVNNGWIQVWDKENLTPSHMGLWDLAYNSTLADVSNFNDINGDWTRFYRQDGSSFDRLKMGMGIVDSRVQGNGLGGNGSPDLPNSGIAALNHKVLPLFHSTTQLGWSSSLIFKGWTDSYKAWKIMGPADNNNTEQDFYLSQTRSDNGQWMTERKIWTSKDFNQSDVNAWSNLTNAVILNQEFTHNTDYGIGIVDYTSGESGLYDMRNKTMVAGRYGEYNKYGSYYKGYEGLNYHCEKQLFGMGRPANDTDKLTVEGSVKAGGNFKSDNEDPNTLFIADGSLAFLNDEITREDDRMRLSHGMIEQQPGVQYYDSDNRMLVIRCVYGEQFTLGKCFRGQRILVINGSDSYGQGFNIESAGYSYKIPPYSSIQLFVWDEKTVYKYAENKMY